ncbi:VOC family protein [Undibacterium squillarum]|uniref:VOC family protein n=1 Tax=Undibacterium squillarum TaxID=1131567 RepID=UPI0035B2A960
MQRVTGFGGVFFRAKDPVALRAWYQRHLGVDVLDWGGAVFPWPSDADRVEGDGTIWSIGGDDHAAFAGSAVPFVISYRVADLRALLAVLKEEGCDVQGDAIDSEFGLFGRVTDPEGNMIELWQPPA